MVSQIRKCVDTSVITNEELKLKLLNIYNNRYIAKGRFFNNNTNENQILTVEEFINYFLNSESILTGYNVLIKNQHQQTSIAIKALENILNKRKYYKQLMEKAEKGSHEYIYYRVMQLTFKILANSYYGIISMESSIFYNAFIQNSITTTGQDLISSAIYQVESLIANNEKFENFDDILRFVSEVTKEKYEINSYLDRNITKDELIVYFQKQSTFNITSAQQKILQLLISKLSDDEINKLFYKNQLPQLLENSFFTKRIIDIFNNGELEKHSEFFNIINNIVTCRMFAWNKFIRISTQKRQASIVTDTDSTFAYLGRLVNHAKQLTNVTDKEKEQNILNFYIQVLTSSLKDIFSIFTRNVQIPEEFRSIIEMKNEFVYSRLVTTRNKKNYGGWLKSELGKPIPGNDPKKHLDIKGLSIRKSTVAKSIRASFQNLLVEDILLPEKINIRTVLRHYNEISEKVKESLMSGSTEFLIPKSVKAFTKYANPGSIEQAKATIIWNMLEPNEEITPPDTVYTLKINAPTENCDAMKRLKEINEEKYNIILKTVFHQEPGEINISSNGFNVVAIPMDREKIPDYLLPIINYNLMVNANVKNANILLESLGIVCFDDKTNKTNYKTNTVEW